MKYYFENFFYLILLVLIVGCTSEEDEIQFTDSTNLRVKTISRYTEKEPSINKTTFLYDEEGKLYVLGQTTGNREFKYDAKKRLIQINKLHYFYDDNDRITKMKDESFNYEGATILYDSTLINYNNGNMNTIEDRFTLNTTDRKHKTSKLYFNNNNQIRQIINSVRHFRIDNNDEYTESTQENASFDYDEKGNIEKVIGEFSFTSDQLISYEHKFSFDDYKNPMGLILKTMGIKNDLILYLPIVDRYAIIMFPSYINHYPSNNIISEKFNTTNSTNYNFYSTYKYNEYGYPTSVERIYTNDNNGEKFTEYELWEYEEY